MELIRDWRLLPALLLASLVLGVGISWNPLLTTAATVGVVSIGAGLMFRHRLPQVFLVGLGIVLTGYAFFSKAFAYLGVPPIYVGEIVLGIGVMAALLDKRKWRAFRSPLAWLLLAFMVWGALRTFPFVTTYGLDALRDGVVWGYGIFALMIPAFLVGTRWLTAIPDRYIRWLPAFLLWVPLGLVLSLKFAQYMPKAPGTEETNLRLLDAAGGVSVHLAGVATLLLLGLHRFSNGRPSKPRFQRVEWAIWLAWLVAFLGAATISRGGTLSVIMAVFGVMLLRPAEAGRKMVLVGMFALLLGGSLIATDTTLDIGDERRKVSAEQIANNIYSIFGGTRAGTNDRLEDTRGWRLRWWAKIVDYTLLDGDYFWGGKGFGVNLAFDDGVIKPGHKEVPNRNPHNAHLTVLARAGVPGALLWVALQCAFGVSLLRAYFRARRARQQWWARVNLWVLAYWLAFLVCMSFTVLLEGPQGGIWFWSVFGLGIAALEAQRQQHGDLGGDRVLVRLEPSAPGRPPSLAVSRLVAGRGLAGAEREGARRY